MFAERQTHAPASEHLAVIGTATRDFTPSIAKISVDLARTEDTLADAKAYIDARAARVIEVARETGIDTSDIRASQLTLAPQYQFRDQRQVFVGHQAQRRIDLTLRDLAQFNALVERLVNVPIDRISKITTLLADPAAARRAATHDAVEDAKQQAEAIAAQLGMRLGGVHAVAVLPKPERLDVMERGRGISDMQPAFEPGSIAVEGRVEVTFRLEP